MIVYPTGCDPTGLMEGTLRLTQTMNQVGSYSRHPCCSSSGVVFFCKLRVHTRKRLEQIMSTTHRGSQVITLVVICLGSFMILLDASIVTLALPRIQADLQWRAAQGVLESLSILLLTSAVNSEAGHATGRAPAVSGVAKKGSTLIGQRVPAFRHGSEWPPPAGSLNC